MKKLKNLIEDLSNPLNPIFYFLIFRKKKKGEKK